MALTSKNSPVNEVRNKMSNQLINMEECSSKGHLINKMASPLIKVCLHAKKLKKTIIVL